MYTLSHDLVTLLCKSQTIAELLNDPAGRNIPMSSDTMHPKPSCTSIRALAGVSPRALLVYHISLA